ncbi:MAG: OmpA family protein [Spirochaetaceae bacterium]|jgi:outer membrane protein OmpA-like peptidoglycan-associated protein|nr:OmpA family protein [Spirochaetaceae bacterium]
MKIMKMMRKLFCVLLLIISFSAYADDLDSEINYFAVQGGIELSRLTISGVSFAGLLDTDFRFLSPLSAGLRIGFGMGSNNISSVEPMLFARWHVFSTFESLRPLVSIADLFVQASIGMDALFRSKSATFSRAIFAADGTIGARIKLPVERLFIQPYIRGGYPFQFSIGASVGYRFKPLSAAPVVITTKEDIIKDLSVEAINYIIFGPDVSELNKDIPQDTVGLNLKTLDEIAAQLTAEPDLLVRMEGYANPVFNTDEEKQDLMDISINRSNNVAAYLESKGVRKEQMIIAAFGGKKKATLTTLSGSEINRRVEVITIRVLD